MEHRNFSRKYLVTLVCLSVVAILLTASASWAWLAVNRNVEEDGYGLSVTVSPNLVVASSVAGIHAMTADTAGNTVVSYHDEANKFLPCTHYANGTELSSLYYLQNTNEVDRTTGLAAHPDLQPAVNSSAEGEFFSESTLYVASTDAPITNSKLRIELETAATIDSDTFSKAAASIDVYADGNYIGALNLAGLDAQVNDASTAKTYLDVTLIGDAVPRNTEGHITLRFVFYFDGALLKTAGRAFVNSDTVSPDDLSMAVKITAVALSE